MPFTERRIYRMRPGQVQVWADLYRDFAKDLFTAHCARPLYFGFGMIGQLNTVVIMRTHDSMEARNAEVAAIGSDPRWEIFKREAMKLNAVEEQSCGIYGGVQAELIREHERIKHSKIAEFSAQKPGEGMTFLRRLVGSGPDLIRQVPFEDDQAFLESIADDQASASCSSCINVYKPMPDLH